MIFIGKVSIRVGRVVVFEGFNGAMKKATVRPGVTVRLAVGGGRSFCKLCASKTRPYASPGLFIHYYVVKDSTKFHLFQCVLWYLMLLAKFRLFSTPHSLRQNNIGFATNVRGRPETLNKLFKAVLSL